MKRTLRIKSFLKIKNTLKISEKKSEDYLAAAA
jgi:hypothetical protein